MVTATAPAPCPCEIVHMAVLRDYVLRFGHAPTRYQGLIHHRCGLGVQPAPALDTGGDSR